MNERLLTQPDPFEDSTVQTVYTFGRKISYNQLWMLLPTDLKTQLVKRQDCHEDGSITITYYLEISERDYRELGGE